MPDRIFGLGASSAGKKEHSDFIFLFIGKEVFVSASMCLDLLFHMVVVDAMGDVVVGDWLHLSV